MINYNTEYFRNNSYFFLKDKGDKVSLYYSVSDTLTESRKKDVKKDFKKTDVKKIKNIINTILNSKKKYTKQDIENKLASSEIEEIVDWDGNMLGSKTPLINQTQHPKKTTDQTVAMTRIPNDPIRRGYRVYWGESKDKEENVVSEVDYSDAFGYEETEDLDFKGTVKTLKKMGVDNAVERAHQFGKLPKSKKVKGKLKQRLSEKDNIEEQQRLEMIKMVEDILTKKSTKNSDVVPKKSNTDSDVVGKEKTISKILLKNLQSIKKIAEKEGISLNQLIKQLNTDE